MNVATFFLAFRIIKLNIYTFFFKRSLVCFQSWFPFTVIQITLIFNSVSESCIPLLYIKGVDTKKDLCL